MALGKHGNKHALGIFPTRQQAENALGELKDANFPMDRVSVVAKDDRQGEIAGIDTSKPEGNKADEGAKTGAVTGGIGGAIVGALESLGLSTFVPLLIPGAGQVLAFGSVAANALATAVAGGAIGAVGGGLVGGLVGWGVPEDRAKVYEHRVARGEYLIMVEGGVEQIEKAESILLHKGGIQEWGVYEEPAKKEVKS